MKNKLPPTFKQKIEWLEIYTLVLAAEISGYSVQHLRRLCRARRVAHLRRGCHIYFTPAQVDALTKEVKPRATRAVLNRRGAYA